MVLAPGSDINYVYWAYKHIREHRNEHGWFSVYMRKDYDGLMYYSGHSRGVSNSHNADARVRNNLCYKINVYPKVK